MNRQTRIVFFVLIVLVGLLAASTSFFLAKTLKTEGPKITPSATGSVITSATEENASSTSTPSSVTKPATSADKPSQPSDTYTIEKGETLFAVAQKNGTIWTELAEANGITDANKIQAGQILIIPKSNQVNFTVNADRANGLQKEVDDGKWPFRLSPADTARSDAPSVYGLAVTDNFTLRSDDKNNGTASVIGSHEGKNYLIKLSQPATRGEKGIWAIESIGPTI